MEQVGVGKPRRQRRTGDVGGQGGEHAGRRACDQLGLVEISLQHGGGLGVAQPRAQARAGDDGLGEQIVLRIEMGIEGAARQAGGQHDVVDVGAGIAAQAEQPAGVTEDFGPGTGGSGEVLGHYMLMIISYDHEHIIRERGRLARIHEPAGGPRSRS
jgi:hypothetical protein